MKFSVVLVTLGSALYAITAANPHLKNIEKQKQQQDEVDYIAKGDERLISSGVFGGKGLKGAILMKENDGGSIESIIRCDLRAPNEADLKVALNLVANKITSSIGTSYSESNAADSKKKDPVFPDEAVSVKLSGEGVLGEMSGKKGTKGEFYVAISAKVNGKNMEQVKTRLKGFADKLLDKFRELEADVTRAGSTGSGGNTGARRLSALDASTGTGVGAGADTGAGAGADTGAGAGADTGAGAGADTGAGEGSGAGDGVGNPTTTPVLKSIEKTISGESGANSFPYFEPKSSTVVGTDGSTYSEEAKWGYTPATSSWNTLFPGCKGGRQSPIDIRTKDLSVSSTETLQITGECKSLKLAPDHEHTYQWDASESTCQVVTSKDELPYTFKQFHIHTPSEHRVNGEKADMEVHFVHTREKDGKEEVLVVAALFNRIPTVHTISYDVQQVTNFITQPRDEMDSRLYQKLLKSFDQFYYYQGSLTTPPCTEGVEWYIIQDSFGIGSDEFNTLKTSMNEVSLSNQGSNKRSIQPLNARTVVTATRSA